MDPGDRETTDCAKPLNTGMRVEPNGCHGVGVVERGSAYICGRVGRGDKVRLYVQRMLMGRRAVYGRSHTQVCSAVLALGSVEAQWVSWHHVYVREGQSTEYSACI